MLWRYGVRGSSSACDEVIKNTRRAEQVQACAKHATPTPPVRSSLFPGPSVCVWGAITHQVPLTSSFGLLRFMTLSPRPYSCRLRSFPAPWLDQAGVWGKRMKGRRQGSSWNEVGSWFDMRWNTHFLSWLLQVIDGHNFLFCGPHVPLNKKSWNSSDYFHECDIWHSKCFNN